MMKRVPAVLFWAFTCLAALIAWGQHASAQNALPVVALLRATGNEATEWNRIFPDPAMTLAAVDRLVHHATIFEMNVESYRRRAALERKRGPGRPPGRATPQTVS